MTVVASLGNSRDRFLRRAGSGVPPRSLARLSSDGAAPLPTVVYSQSPRSAIRLSLAAKQAARAHHGWTVALGLAIAPARRAKTRRRRRRLIGAKFVEDPLSATLPNRLLCVDAGCRDAEYLFRRLAASTAQAAQNPECEEFFWCEKMCDLAKERAQIESILSAVLDGARERRSLSGSELLNLGLAALRTHYEDKCPDDCIRRKCEDYVGRFTDEEERQGQGDGRPANAAT